MADPVSTAIIAAVGATGTTATVITSAVRIGFGLLISTALSRGQDMPDQQSVSRSMEDPQEQPKKRTAYGLGPASGTPGKHYKTDPDSRRAYGWMLLSSRPSAGPATSTGDPDDDFKIYVDDRPCQPLTLTENYDPTTGIYSQDDIFDFAGDGYAAFPEDFSGYEGSGDNEEFLRLWIGKGDQSGPPDRIKTETSDHFTDSDIGEGCTVLWYRMDQGKDAEKRQRRWPTFPRLPSIRVMMPYTKVYDMREVSHDADDETTWAYSANQALCLLDALRMNPVGRYAVDQLVIDQFEEGADVADESVDLLIGGTESRYETHGVVRWTGAELMSLIDPLAQVGAGRLVRVGAKLGYCPGKYYAPAITVDDCMDYAPISFTAQKKSRDMPSVLKASFQDPDRDFATAELFDIAVDGASTQVDDENARVMDLGFSRSRGQTRRVQKIEAKRLSAQKSLRFTGYPETVKLAPGSTFTADFDGLSEMDGVYKVEKSDPTAFLSEGGKIALHHPLEAVEEQSAYYTWSEDEEVSPLSNVTVTTPAAGEINATGVAPYTRKIAGVRFYRASTGAAFSTASAIGTTEAIDSQEGYDITATGVTSGAADFWLVPVDDSDSPVDTPLFLETHTIT